MRFWLWASENKIQCLVSDGNCRHFTQDLETQFLAATSAAAVWGSHLKISALYDSQTIYIFEQFWQWPSCLPAKQQGRRRQGWRHELSLCISIHKMEAVAGDSRLQRHCLHVQEQGFGSQRQWEVELEERHKRWLKGLLQVYEQLKEN